MGAEQVRGASELYWTEIEGGIWDDIAACGVLSFGVAFNVGEGAGGVEQRETANACSAAAGLL